jgi:hypothetical protein
MTLRVTDLPRYERNLRTLSELNRVDLQSTFSLAIQMSRFTVKVSDDKHARLRALAQSRGTTLNGLIDEMTTMMLASNEKAHDAEVRFRLRAAIGQGKTARGLALLKKAATKARCVGCVFNAPKLIRGNADWRNALRAVSYDGALKTHPTSYERLKS